ncbi:MAG: PTS sugar transporter subunit IIC [Schleiferilactobacillus perolens]
MSPIITAILLALTAMLANGEYFLGSSMLSRPLVTCTIAGYHYGQCPRWYCDGCDTRVGVYRFIFNWRINSTRNYLG